MACLLKRISGLIGRYLSIVIMGCWQGDGDFFEISFFGRWIVAFDGAHRHPKSFFFFLPRVVGLWSDGNLAY